MGAESKREDTDPTSKVGTEPGLGPGSDPNTAATVEDELPPPVDFDALHAALGDPLELDDLPPAAHEVERTPPEPLGGDSSGRSSATYASARPHTIPPTRAPNEDLNAPAVIVATEALDTVPSAAPKMTIPVRGAPPLPNPQHGMPIPHGPPSSGPHPAAAANFPGTPPQGFPPQRHVAQMTVRMPERPVNRRPKSPTVVVRPRGPSPRQKLVAFAAMLMLFTACGIAVVIWQRPGWVGLEEPKPAPSASVIPSAAAPPPPPATTSAAPTASTAAPSASTAPKPPKPATPPKPGAPPATPTSAPKPAGGGGAGEKTF